MKPTLITAIRGIVGDKLTQPELEQIADVAIRIVEEKQKAVAMKTIEVMQEIAQHQGEKP